MPVGMKIEIGDFAEAISTRIWESVGRANWRPFALARDFVRTLGMKSQAQWDAYVDSGRFPRDLPKAPHMVYADAGWRSWGDWLGTERIANQLRRYLPFNEARTFVRSLGLK